MTCATVCLPAAASATGTVNTGEACVQVAIRRLGRIAIENLGALRVTARYAKYCFSKNTSHHGRQPTFDVYSSSRPRTRAQGAEYHRSNEATAMASATKIGNKMVP